MLIGHSCIISAGSVKLRSGQNSVFAVNDPTFLWLAAQPADQEQMHSALQQTKKQTGNLDRKLTVSKSTIPGKAQNKRRFRFIQHGCQSKTGAQDALIRTLLLNRGRLMIESIDHTSAETCSYSHLDCALKEAYSDRHSQAHSEKSSNTGEMLTIDFGAGDIYSSHIIDTSTQGSATNEQPNESSERFSSRMNREVDRQPYLDPQRHGNEISAADSNEQSPELNEGFRSRMNKQGDPQPYLDPERHQQST